MTNNPQRRHCKDHVTHFKVFGPRFIYGTGEARASQLS